MTMQILDNGKSFGEQRGKINNNFAVLESTKITASSVLTKTNTTPFTPTGNYHPVPKIYADNVGASLVNIYDPTGISLDAFDRSNHYGMLAASFITQDSDYRFVTDINISNWNQKEDAVGAKGTAFNKNFGTIAGSISEGNHIHSKLSVGLGNVDNTSDANKPVSTLQQVALDEKSNKVYRVINRSGSVIPKGSACRPVGVDSSTSLVKIELSLADTASNSNVFGLATDEIGIDSEGELISSDNLDMDLTGVSVGVPLYLSDTTPGGFTEVPPKFITQIGGALIGGASGKLCIKIVNHISVPALANSLYSTGAGKLLALADGFNDTKINIRDIRTDGTSVWIDFDAEGGGDITFRYGGNEYTLDATTGDGPDGLASIELIQGTDEEAAFQIIYMAYSETSQTVEIFTSQIIPNGGFGPVCYCLCPTAAKVQADDSTIYIHRISDVMQDGERGELSVMSEKLRLGTGGNNRIVGCDVSAEIVTNGSSRDSINLASLSGTFYQMRRHNWEGYESETYGIRIIGQKVGECIIKNNDIITDLGIISETAEGATIADGDSIFIDIAGLGTSCNCKKLIALISKEAYDTPEEAVTWAKSLPALAYPSNMRHLCFTLGRMVLTYSSANGGTWTNALGTTTSTWIAHTANDSQTGYPGYVNGMSEIFSNHNYPGASHVRAYVKVDTEANYDFANFKNSTDPFPADVAARRTDPLSYSGDIGVFHTASIPGDTIRCQFTSDGSVIGGDGAFIYRIESLHTTTTGDDIIDMR